MRVGRSANGRSGSRNVLITSNAKSTCRKPLSASSCAISNAFPDKAKRAVQSRTARSWPDMGRALLGLLLFSLAIYHLAGDVLVLKSGISIHQTSPLLFALFLGHPHGLRHLD